MMINLISKSSEFIQILICKIIAGLYLFKRNEKKNRKGTLTPKVPFVEHQLPRAYHLNVFTTFLKRK